MQYNITVNQLALADSNLDLVDAAILSFLFWFCNSADEKIESHRVRDDSGVWTWVNYRMIIDEMPLLRIKAGGAITPRIKRIEAGGFISTRRIGHQKLFIKLNSKVDELFTNMNRAVHQTEQSYSRKRTNHIIKNNNTKIRGEETPLFLEFWKVYPNKKGRVAALKAWEKLHVTEDMFHAIIKSVRDHQKTRQWLRDSGDFIPHPATFLNQRRFEDELKEPQRSLELEEYNRTSTKV